jgi:hypothetical protein
MASAIGLREYLNLRTSPSFSKLAHSQEELQAACADSTLEKALNRCLDSDTK